MSTEPATRRAACQIDFGSEGYVEIEIEKGGFWAGVDKPVDHVDIWLKAVAEGIDLRVRIDRIEGGLAVAVDRGDIPGPWGTAGNAPALRILLDEALEARVTASAGQAVAYPLSRVRLVKQG